MATINDEKIKELLKTIEDKKAKLGSKPKASWETNGVINGKNINTISSIDSCVELASSLLMQKGFYENACELLGVSKTESASVKEIDAALTDLKLKVSILKYSVEEKKLAVLEKQLKDLRSEDAKTADALSDIMSSLS